MVKNIVKLKQAARIPAKDYHHLVQALTIEIHPESIQLSGHWTDGNGNYYSRQVGNAVHLSDLNKARQLTLNVLQWTKQELSKLDAAIFEPLEGSRKTGNRKYTRSAEVEQQMGPVRKRLRKS